MKGSFSALIAPQRSLDARLRGHDSGEIMVVRRHRMAKVCDCFPQLKEITDARERRYRADPEKPAPEGPQSFVEVKVTSIGELNELVECKRSGFKFVISEPAHVGGHRARSNFCSPARSAAMPRCSPSTRPSSGSPTTASRRSHARSSTRAGI